MGRHTIRHDRIIGGKAMEKHFEYEKVEICRRCGGTGALHTENGDVTCDLCAGTGRVIKKTQGSVTIRPYLGTGD